MLTNGPSCDETAAPTPWYLEDVTQGLSPDHTTSLSFTLDELLQNYVDHEDDDIRVDQSIDDLHDHQVENINSLKSRYPLSREALENASEDLPNYIDDQPPPYCFFDIDIDELVQID